MILNKEQLEQQLSQYKIMLFACRSKTEEFILFMHENPKIEKEFKKWLSEKRKVKTNDDQANITSGLHRVN